MTKLFDTWAWIEFYQGSELGGKIYEIIKSDEDIHTSTVTLAELSDNYQKENLQTDHSWKQILGYIETHSEIKQINPQIASEAGKIKKKQRENYQDFGLMDGIILATAREHNLELVTRDKHLKGKDKAIDLEP